MDSDAFPLMRLGSIFLSALGVLLAIASALGQIGLAPLFASLVISFLISLIYYIAWYRPRYLMHHNFFGLATGSLNVVVSSYNNRVDFNLGASNDPKANSTRFRYKKEAPLDR